jgi:oligo-1,6-glucosidase
MDSDGDGVGDLPGLISRLDHLQDLGVDAVWLSPHYPSGGVDNGYDVTDYRSVDPRFGTMRDFDELVAELAARGMRLIVDLVVNHTSDRHPWFEEARKSRDSPFRDHYIWRDGRDGGPPNNWPSIFGGPAWTFDAASGQYYLHLFAPGQPDLNWDNPKVRAEVHDIMRFWLGKGVAGFRMDVIAFVSKPPGLPDLTPEVLQAPQRAYANGPRRDEYLRELHDAVMAGNDTVAIGEAFGITAEETERLVDADRRELDMVFTFDLVDLSREERADDWTLPQLKALLTRLDRAGGPRGWNSFYLENHDQPRAVSHFGDADPAWSAASAKALATLLLTQRATPFVYQGQEIGMANYPFAGIEAFEDVAAHGRWAAEVRSGRRPAEAVLNSLRWKGRDNARTPMQWTKGPNAGFTTGRPWLPANPNARTINVAAQNQDPDSVLAHYRRLIALRRSHRGLVFGAFRDLDPAHEHLIAYVRDEAYLVLLNFSREPIDFAPPSGISLRNLLIASGKDPETTGGRVRLQGWQSAIYAI